MSALPQAQPQSELIIYQVGRDMTGSITAVRSANYAGIVV